MSQQTIHPTGTVEGRLRVPGDKSISHRALMVAAAGHGDCRIRGLSEASDVRTTISALRLLSDLLGPDLSQLEREGSSPQGSDWEILARGRGLQAWRNPGRVLDCGNSGTTMRTLLGLLAGCPFQATLDGDESLRRRPMDRVADPLSAMGAAISTQQDKPPIVIRGGRLQGINYALPVASAQVKTALLFAGLRADGETVLTGRIASRDHTERLLQYVGVPIDISNTRLIAKSTDIQNAEWLSIPGDMSSAAFLLVAAAITPGSEVTIEGVGLNPTRTGILQILDRYGADVLITGETVECGEPRGTVRVRGHERRPITITSDEVPAAIDELPLVAVLGAYAEGETRIEGAAELRLKESDRIRSTAAGLEALGVSARPTDDGLIVRGGRRPTGGTVRAHGDHRIAMAFAVAALGATDPVVIEGWDAVAVSYPRFLADLTALAPGTMIA